MAGSTAFGVFTFNTSIALAPDTEYWIVLTDNSAVTAPDGQSTILWSYADGLTGVGVATQYSYADGGSFPNANVSDSTPFQGGAFQMQVDAIPEPASLTILGGSLLGLAGLRRRQGWQASWNILHRLRTTASAHLLMRYRWSN